MVEGRRERRPSPRYAPATGSAPARASADRTSNLARVSDRSARRVSKWDRPPAPKDWRFFVGTLGKVLISTGVLMFGFVGYQLWGTGIETARTQDRLENGFEEAFAAATGGEGEAPATTVAPTTTVPATAPDGSTPPSTDPTATTAPNDPPDGVFPPSDLVPGGVDLSSVAVDRDLPDIKRGEAFARLEIPTIGKELYIVPGVAVEDLKKGPGHYPETPLPGQLGNASVAGHRTTYGAPFFDVDQIAVGDQMTVTLITGERFVYQVTATEVVTAEDYWVVTTRDPNVAELTLTSCHPKYTARERYVVHSVLVPELSAPVGLAKTYELDDLQDGIAGEQPTIASTTTVPQDAPTTTAAAATGSSVPSTSAPVTTVPATTVPTTEPPVADLDPSELDPFGRGWFEDEQAWPQIALWGLALTVISLVAYRISRRTRHDSIGFVVGIAPFLVSLYFFFQNVNRLLPPGL